jgi:hypothetical protein
MRLSPYGSAGDWLYSTLLFYRFHKRLPQRSWLLNDYLHQLKISNELNDPARAFVTDKEYLKLFVRAVLEDSFNVPTLSIIRHKAHIYEHDFPLKCCIKPTHLSGECVFRSNGESIDLDRLAKWFDINYYKMGREQNYKYLAPKIIVEPILFGDKDKVLDYKIFCFNGIPKIVQVDLDRHTNHTRKLFDTKWNELYFSMRCERSRQVISPPHNLSRMFEVASKLSSYFSFMRVDLYSDGVSCFVGELTSCPFNACCNFSPTDAEHEASKLIFADRILSK